MAGESENVTVAGESENVIVNGESENVTVAIESENVTVDVVEDDVKYGFKRPEMYQVNLSGTVDPPYGRHVFLCYKTHEVWPARVEESDADPLPKLLAGAFKARRTEFTVRSRLTVCEGGEDLKLSDGDVLVFPDMIKYKGLKESDVDGFVEDVLVNGKPWASGEQEEFTGSYVFVCAHNNRDRRCGVCGPILMEKFNEEIEAKDLKNQVSVIACSHIGGHKYAGNLIIYSADPEGKIAGHWYGYVTPDDVSELLDQHIGKGEIIQKLWRGKMGIPVEETGKLDEPKLPNGSTVETIEEKPEENVGGGCCQGVSGFQCCRDGSVEEEKSGKKKTLGGLFDWTCKWEQREVFTAVALVGAVATVAVAYGCYRKSR